MSAATPASAPGLNDVFAELSKHLGEIRDELNKIHGFEASLETENDEKKCEELAEELESHVYDVYASCVDMGGVLTDIAKKLIKHHHIKEKDVKRWMKEAETETDAKESEKKE